MASEGWQNIFHTQWRWGDHSIEQRDIQAAQAIREGMQATDQPQHIKEFKMDDDYDKATVNTLRKLVAAGEWQTQTGRVVARDGRIGKPQTSNYFLTILRYSLYNADSCISSLLKQLVSIHDS